MHLHCNVAPSAGPEPVPENSLFDCFSGPFILHQDDNELLPHPPRHTPTQATKKDKDAYRLAVVVTRLFLLLRNDGETGEFPSLRQKNHWHTDSAREGAVWFPRARFFEQHHEALGERALYQPAA